MSSEEDKKKNEEPACESEEDDVKAMPLGEVVKVSGKGRGTRKHYGSFEYDGLQYQLEDYVLLTPEKADKKPYVAIIKDITQTWKGALMVTGQWFYRPEDAEKKGGGKWQSRDNRELFYSFHRNEVAAEAVMHKCVVHFIPLNKRIPHRKEHPGFIVQRVYDFELRRLSNLTDKDYKDDKQHEIDLLLQKSLAHLGDLPDIEPEGAIVDHDDQLKNKRLLRKRSIAALEVSIEGEGFNRSQSFKAASPGNASEYYVILLKFNLLTGESRRDKWLEKLLESIRPTCAPVDSKQNDEREHVGNKNGSPNHTNESHDKGDASSLWPDAAVRAVTALEKAVHDTLSADFQKYNQKMRQLNCNLTNAVLARRLLNWELEPAQILNMSPSELKEGLRAEEMASKEPEEPGCMQMTDARCKRCLEKKVGLRDIIQAGRGDRYKLECVLCGNTWYTSRDNVSTVTIEGPSSTKAVGTAPLATAKFEDVEKKLVSPCGLDKGSDDVVKKTTEADVPVLDKQKSFKQAEENRVSTK